MNLQWRILDELNQQINTTCELLELRKTNEAYLVLNKTKKKLLNLMEEYSPRLTVEEAACRLGVCKKQIYRYIKSGKLKASKQGNWKIKETEIRRFITSKHKDDGLLIDKQTAKLLNLTK